MSQARRAAALAAALGLSACAGGGGDSPPQPATFTLRGTIRALAATDADGDTNDVSAPKAHNDTAAAAQALPAAVTVGGWASETLDPADWYRATLAAGQVVGLQMADWTAGGPNDLDLCVYRDAIPPVRVACSVGSGAVEAVPIPAAGAYLIQVTAFSGSSRYVLTLAEGPLAIPPVGALFLGAEFVPGEVMVRFKDGHPAKALASGLATRAASLGLLPLGGAEGREMLLGLGGGAARAQAFAMLGAPEPARDLAAEVVDPLEAPRADTIALVKALRRRPDVASADPNYVFHPTLVPNDEFYAPRQWDLPMMNLPAAWDVTTGTPEKGGQVIVAVVDTGVFLAHPDLAPKLVAGYDFVSDAVGNSNDGDGIDPNPDDPGDDLDITQASFHGTHVAGTVGAATGNGTGIAGVSWGARIMPMRALGLRGGTSGDLIQAIRFAAGLPNDSGTVPPQRADVINLSLGCPGCSSATEQAAYAAVRAAGVIVVAAAGNDNTSFPSYPAAYDGVISVSAVGKSGARAPYSNFGPTVDIAAPGGDQTVNDLTRGIYSTWVNGSVDPLNGARIRQPTYRFLQGTSMATPHVAGVVALMKAVCPTLTPAQVDAFLATGGMTDDRGATGRDDLFGYGLVNAQKSVSTASSQCLAPLAGTLDVAPADLEFAPSRSTLSVAARLGSGTLSGSVTAAADASWLTLAPPASANGIGSWTASVSRVGLAAGAYAAGVTFTAPFASGTVTVRVPVTMQVGGVAGATGDAGYLHIRVLDAHGNAVKEVAMSATSGQYAYAFTGLPAGSYTVVAGTEMSGGNVLCGPGDACGAFPAPGAPSAVDLAADRSEVDFSVGFDVALGAAAQPGGAASGQVAP
jgi:serine protease